MGRSHTGYTDLFPQDTVGREVYIPTRFWDRVGSHYLGNALQLDGFPLIMCIVGRPGMGKTWQLRQCLKLLNVKAFSISASRLEDERAGEPAKYLERTYLLAGDAMRSGELSAVVIDDFDTTVGEWENNTGTVNHQAILASLMHIAEDPVHLGACDEVGRVPIYITANHLDRIYAPLVRYGRTDVFNWEPRIDEKTSAILSILRLSEEDRGLAADLALSHPDEPLSFYSHLLMYVQVKLAYAALGSSNLASVIKDKQRLCDLKRACDEAAEGIDWVSVAKCFSEEHESLK